MRLHCFLQRYDLSSLVHLTLRLGTLVLRFALTFHIVRVLGYEAAGVYGLAVGAIGIVPAAIGWGLNYFLARDIVGIPVSNAAALLKSRLTVTVATLVVGLCVGSAVLLWLDVSWTGLVGLIALLVVFETIGLDIHMPLLSRDKGRLANVLVFVRSALWVPFLIGGGYLLPQLNSLTALFAFWIAAHLVALAILVVAVPRPLLARTWRAPLRRDWIRDRLRHSWTIYLSDVGLVGTLFADRYIVTALLGIEMTGLYTFYWSLTNALQTLVTTAVVQILFPSIVRTFADGDARLLRATLKRQTIRISLIAAAMGIGVLAFGELAAVLLPGHDMTGSRGVFLCLVLAAVVRTVSELLNLGLTAMHKDNHYAAFNVAGIVLSLAMAYVLISTLGFLGVGIASLTTATVLLLGRAVFIDRLLRHADGAASSLRVEYAKPGA